MTISSVELTAAEAQRLTMKIKLTAATVRDNMVRLNDLVSEAKAGSAHVVLGFASWQAYLKDTLGDDPLRLSTEDRISVVRMLANEDMSIRAIAPIVGSTKSQVARDLARVPNGTPAQGAESVDAPTPRVEAQVQYDDGEWSRNVVAEPEPNSDPLATGTLPDEDYWTPEPDVAPVVEEPKKVTGLDGKTYKIKPRQERRRSLVDEAFTANRALVVALGAVQGIRADDRFNRNKADIQAALQPSVRLALEILSDLEITSMEESNA